MSIWLTLAAAAVGYLFGSFSAAIILTRSRSGDIRDQGSGNAGATNVARVYGLGIALAALFGDMLKTALALLLGRLLAGDIGASAAAFGCLLGHCWPLYFGFRGGKAVSVGTALAFLLEWRLGVFLAAVFLLAAFASKRVSLASVTTAVLFPFCMWLLGGFLWHQYALGAFIAVLVPFMHRGNIRRLLAGQEPPFRLGHRKP